MKNANCDPDELRRILNISQHYQVIINTGNIILPFHYDIVMLSQGIHTNCHESSPCCRPNYSPSKTKLTDQAVIDVYEKALKQTQIYRYAESYCRVCMHVM